MSSEPSALPAALRSLEQFLESLAAELRDRRAPLECALGNLLFVWDMDFGPHEIAARLDAVGAAVRAAGLQDVVRQMHTGRATRPDLPGGKLAGFALLDAAVDGDGKHVAGLLAMLHDRFPHLKSDAREALARAGEQLLVVWCDRHAADYPIQFRDKVKRLAIDLYLIEQ